MPETHVHELISQSLDGTLSAAEERVLKAHLESCAECREEAIQLRGLDEMFRHLPTIAPAEGFAERVMARLEAREARAARDHWLFALVLLLGVSLVSGVWAWSNPSAVLDSLSTLLATYDAVPILLNLLFGIIGRIGELPLLLYGFIVLAMTMLWVYAVTRLGSRSVPVPI